MTADILNGKMLATQIQQQLKQQLKKQQLQPHLAVIWLGDQKATEIYIRHKKMACQSLGIAITKHHLSQATSQQQLISLIEQLNDDDHIHAILLQLPLPLHLDTMAITQRIAPSKDIDGLRPDTQAKRIAGEEVFIPCTAKAVMAMIQLTKQSLAGKKAAVIGDSIVAGQPVATELKLAGVDVAIYNKATQNLAEKITTADIIAIAIGQPQFIQGPWLKLGVIVIDIGINYLDGGKIVGDVDFVSASEKASFITPVPGGIGPVTVAMLLTNTIQAAQLFEG